MCTRNRLLLLMFGLLANTAGAESPGFGQPASEADIAEAYWSVFPDGENLPAGGGDADEGRALYNVHCVACHGVEGVGLTADVLVGGQDSLASATPLKTVGSYWPYAPTVFNYVRRAMPYTAPMSLSNDEYYAITAYLLDLNGVLESGQVVNAETLPAMRMPNRDGFVVAYPNVPEEYDYRD